MSYLIIRQQFTFRGVIPAVRINGRSYIFTWNENVKAYAWAAPTMEDANRLLMDNHNARMFVPGVAIVPDLPVKKVTPVQPTPTNIPTPVTETVITSAAGKAAHASIVKEPAKRKEKS